MCFLWPRTSIQSPPLASTSFTRFCGSISLRCWSMTIPLRVSGERDRAAVGRKLAGQQLEQRRLARAVRADQPDAVAALHAQREIADDRPFAEAFRHAIGVDHDLRLHVVLGERQLGRARRAQHRRPLGAHLVELGEAALVAPPPRGHAALEPVELELQLGIELLRRARFLVIDALGPRLEAAEADLGSPQTGRGRARCSFASAASGRSGRG